MGLFDFLRSRQTPADLALQAKASEHFQAVLWSHSPGAPVYTPRNYASLAKEGYEKCSVVFACVDAVAQTSASVPLKLKRKLAGGQTEEVDDHPAIELLERPNPMDSERELRAYFAAFLLLSGNSYLHGPGPTSQYSSRRGQPIELWNLRPDKMKVKAGMWMEPIGGYTYTEGKPVELEASAVMHAKLFHPRHAFYGLSPIEAAARAVDQHNAAGDWNTAVLQNLAVPPAWVNLKGNVPPETKEDLKEQFGSRLAGPKNAKKPIFTRSSEGIDYHRLGFTNVELDWLEGKKMNAFEICSVFNVPPQIIGLPDSQTYANFEQAEKSLYTRASLPVVSLWCDSLTRWLLLKYPDGRRLYFEPDISQIQALQEDQNELAKRAATLFLAGVVTQRQAVRMVGEDDDFAQDLYVWDLKPAPGASRETAETLKAARKAFADRLGLKEGDVLTRLLDDYSVEKSGDGYSDRLPVLS